MDMCILTLMIECGVKLEILTHQQSVLVLTRIATGTPTGQALVLLTIHALRPTMELQASVLPSDVIIAVKTSVYSLLDTN